MADYQVTPDGLNLPSRTSDPETLIEGLLWHRSDKKTIDYFVNGEIRSLPDTSTAVIDNIQLQLLAEQLVAQRNTSILLEELIEQQKITNEQLDIIKEIANGKFGLWSVSAQVAIAEGLEATFIEEFQTQLKDAAEPMKKNFPEYIINTLK